MTSGFPRKALLALLWIVPTLTLAASFSARVTREKTPPPAPKPETVRVPVQMIQSGKETQVVYVDLETDAVPEPSSLILLPFSLLVLMRRKR